MPGKTLYFNANGKQVHSLTWNWDDRSLPVLILVHGFAGHAHWWSFLAPFFCDRFRIVAIDLPGMGDSEALEKYHDESFSNALLALVEAQHLKDITLIGHSFGGATSLNTLLREQQPFKQAVIIDSFLSLVGEPALPKLNPGGKHKIRTSQSECVERFRLTPEQPIVEDYLRHYVGFYSCFESQQGWRWKFDPCMSNFGEFRDIQTLSTINTRVDLIYGECSLFNDNQRPQKIQQYLGNPGELILVPGAYHHIMMDHPLELVTAINHCLAR